MIMVAFVVTGCQSNEEKYAQLKVETTKIIETVLKESSKHEIHLPTSMQSKKERIDSNEKAFKIFADKMPTIEKNVKEMEKLSIKELKLANDFKMFNDSYVKTVRRQQEIYKSRLEDAKKAN